MDFLVLTKCATYNHENYITDAMNGFAMQQTTFPVVSVIIDDASTDKTASVIRTYLKEHFALANKEIYFAILLTWRKKLC